MIWRSIGKLKRNNLSVLSVMIIKLKLTLNFTPKKKNRVTEYMKNRYATDEEYSNKIKEQESNHIIDENLWWKQVTKCKSIKFFDVLQWRHMIGYWWQFTISYWLPNLMRKVNISWHRWYMKMVTMVMEPTHWAASFEAWIV